MNYENSKRLNVSPQAELKKNGKKKIFLLASGTYGWKICESRRSLLIIKNGNFEKFSQFLMDLIIPANWTFW